MPFKIVETLEKGSPKLSIVPSRWEKKGLLRWPPKTCAISKLVRDENSSPLLDWLTVRCHVKRTSIPTFARAEEEVNFMMECSLSSDSSDIVENHDRNAKKYTKNNYYDDLDENLITHQVIQQTSCSPTSNDILTTASEDPIDIKPNLLQNPNSSPPRDNSPTTEIYVKMINDDINRIATVTPTQSSIDQILSNQKIIMKNQQLIMNNQFLMHETQKSMLQQENKTVRKLKDITIQLDDSFSRISRHNSTVVTLNNSNNDNEALNDVTMPVTNIKDLENIEHKLNDKTVKAKLKSQYLFLCSANKGSGYNCAYKLLDVIFTREFLCLCSWAGGSRSDVSKIALKGYKNVLKFFFEMIHSWDPTYTQDDNEKFFKNVLRNALKRKEMKNLRASTKRKRRRKIITNKLQKTSTVVQENSDSNTVPETDVPIEIHKGNIDNTDQDEP